MREQALAPWDCHIQQLAHKCPGTAADTLPITLWVDVISQDTGHVSLWGGDIEGDLRRLNRQSLLRRARPMWRHCNFFSVYVVRQGQGTHVIEGKPYGIARGDVYTMGVGMSHYFLHCDYLELDSIHFSPQIFDSPTLHALNETPGFQSLFLNDSFHPPVGQPGSRQQFHLTPDAHAHITQMVAELRAEWLAGTPIGNVLTRGLLLRLLAHLLRLYTNNQTVTQRAMTPVHARGEAAVAAAVRYMDEHYVEPIRIDQIAGMVFLSSDRFREVFAAIMGCTPRDYLRYVRLEHARTLLSTTDSPIAEIAQNTGFGEVTYFNRVFRAMTGMTPSGYRHCMAHGVRAPAEIRS